MNYLTHMQSGESTDKLSLMLIPEPEPSVPLTCAFSEPSSSLSTIASTSSTFSTSSTSTPGSTPGSTPSSESDYSGFYMLSLVEEMSQMDETILLKTHGYIKEREIGTITQGKIFLARKDEQLAVIKRIEKELHESKVFVRNDFTYTTDKSIEKEAMILKSIACNKDPTNLLIITYIDSFESNEHYYLVQEYIEDSITLKDFVIKAHKYITAKQLELGHYKKSITLILYQLAVALNSLHNNHKCVHLDIAPENILLRQSDIIQNSDGSVYINPKMEIKIKDFGLSEQFQIDDNKFECNKQLSIDNEQYLCPAITNENRWDGSAVDMWAFGMTAYFCYMGNYPYTTMQFSNDLTPTPKVGTDYWALLNGTIKQRLAMNNKLQFVNPRILSLLKALLKVDPNKRLKSVNVLKHKLFSCIGQKC